jgi:hypothetical protein
VQQLVGEVERVEPDFARPDGDYTAWRIESRMGEQLDGFDHWRRVEGELVRAAVCASLHWLGLFDVGYQADGAALGRLTPLGAALLHDAELAEAELVEPIVLQPNFEVLAPANASPAARFQLGRIAELAGGEPTAVFRLTRRSVQHALQEGITLDDIVAFLERETRIAPPQNVLMTLREWAGEYGRISIRRSALLEADTAATLERIRNDRRIRLPNVHALDQQLWELAPGDAAGLTERLRKAGYAVASDAEAEEQSLSERDLTVIYAALAFYAAAGEQLGYEHDVRGALLRRVAQLLPERQQHRAYQQCDAALEQLQAVRHRRE